MKYFCIISSSSFLRSGLTYSLSYAIFVCSGKTVLPTGAEIFRQKNCGGLQDTRKVGPRAKINLFFLPYITAYENKNEL
jgi:hypothetical protein